MGRRERGKAEVKAWLKGECVSEQEMTGWVRGKYRYREAATRGPKKLFTTLAAGY